MKFYANNYKKLYVANFKTNKRFSRFELYIDINKMTTQRFFQKQLL